MKSNRAKANYSSYKKGKSSPMKITLKTQEPDMFHIEALTSVTESTEDFQTRIHSNPSQHASYDC